MQSLELLFENTEEIYNEEEITLNVESTGVFRHYPTTLTLKTERTGAPASLTGEIVDVTKHMPKMGATVRLKVDGVLMFFGYVFQTSIDKYGVLSFTAYDSIRYLKNTYTNYYPKTYTIDDVIVDMAISFNLAVGNIAKAPTIGQALTIDNECALDVICKLVETATILSGRILVFYCNGQDLTLSYADEMIADVLVGDNSLATEYTLSTSIDEDTYNQVFLYHQSESAGRRIFSTQEDKNRTKMWGVLRLTEGVDDIMSQEQLEDRARKMLDMKCRALKTMSITALGVVGLRAGMMITIHFPSITGDNDELVSISKKQTVILDSVTHNFEDGNHTMTLEVHTFWKDT